MSAIAGVWYARQVADAINGLVRDRNVSIAFGDIGDSNYDYDTFRGNSGGFCYALDQLGIPLIATVPTVSDSNATSKRQNRDEYPNDTHDNVLRDSGATSAPDAIEPWLNTTCPTKNNWFSQRPIAVTNSPSANGQGGNAFANNDSTTRLNAREAMDIYIAHVKEDSLTSHAWAFRGSSSGTIASGTLSQDNGGAATFTVERVHQFSAASRTNSFYYMMPLGVSATNTGWVNIFAMFATWPNRAHGYVNAPLTCVGGQSLSTQKVGWVDEMTSEYQQGLIRCIFTAMSGKAFYFMPRIIHGLNDRNAGSPANTQAGYKANLEAVLAEIDAAVAAVAPDFPNYRGTRCIFAPVLHRIPTNQASNDTMDFVVAAQKEVAAARGDSCVIDRRGLYTDTEAARISDNPTTGVHLSSEANYQRVCNSVMNGLVAACAMSVSFRGTT